MLRLKIRPRSAALPRMRKFRQQRLSCLRFNIALLAVLISFVNAPFASSQDGQPSEYQLKAAFLFNFAKFVDWPEKTYASPQSPFMLCVIGQDPFGGALDEYLAKTMGGRSVQMAHFPNETLLAGARQCQITF